jgi:hypothetical protein
LRRAALWTKRPPVLDGGATLFAGMIHCVKLAQNKPEGNSGCAIRRLLGRP